MVLTLHPGCHLEVGRSCAVRQSPTRSRQRVQMTSRLVNAATHGGTARAGRCTPVRLRRTSVTRGWSITTNTSGTHRTQPVTATLLRNRRREKTVVRKQLDPQRAPFAPLLWARPWYTQAVTEKELHTRTPHGAKKERRERKHLRRARVAAAVWVSSATHGTQSSTLQQLPPNGYTGRRQRTNPYTH